MGQLENPRHEKMARYMAQGMPVDEAHQAAGYAYSKPAAIMMGRQASIRDRIAELMQEQEENLTNEENEVPDGQMILEDVVLTQSWLLKQLSDNVLKAKRAGQFSASNKAIEMLGEYLGGMFTKAKGATGEGNKVPVPSSDNPSENLGKLLEFAQTFNAVEQNLSNTDKQIAELPVRVKNPIMTPDEDA